MGRGQTTTVRDHFSTVFGERRGSKDAQSERDREESADIMRRALLIRLPVGPAQAPDATVTTIPIDQCICGTRRKRPRSDCWASTHDCE